MNDPSIRDLLPPYLGHQAWLDLCDAMDEVFKDDVYLYADALSHIRARYVPISDAVLEERRLIGNEEYATYDQVTNRMRLNHLGLQLSDPSIVTADQLLQFTRNVGQYWFGKGLADSADFIAYCLNAEVTVVPLWATQVWNAQTQKYEYSSFSEEPGGATVHDNPPGPWFPTTHVRMRFDQAKFNSAQVPVLVKLFYDVGNYNLVLESVYTDLLSFILASQQMPGPEAVAAGPAFPAPVLSLTHYAVITYTHFSE